VVSSAVERRARRAAKRALDGPQAVRQRLLEAEAQVALAETAVDAAEAARALQRRQADQADWNRTERHILERQAELRDLIQGATAQELALVKAEVALAEATLHLTMLQRERPTICAPVSGTVTARMIHPGETALPGATLLSVADPRNVYVVIYLPQTAPNGVFLGQRVDVTVDSLPLSRFESVVTHIASEAQYTPRDVSSKDERVNTVYEVRLRLPNP
jgi:HlyD family secretion protein